MTFGERLTQARKAAKMSQQQLADSIGVTQGMVSHWATGRKLGIDSDTLSKLESVLALPAGELAQHLPVDHPARKLTDAGVRVLGYAGAGPDIDVPFEEEILRLGPEFAGCVSYRARGNSMVGDLIGDGDYVLFHPAESIEPKPGNVVIAWIAAGQGGHVLKKLDKKGQLISTGVDRWVHKLREGDKIIGVARGVIRKI